MTRWLKALLIPAVLLGGPAFCVAGPFHDWRFWLFYALCVALIRSQPDLKYSKLGKEQRTSEDRSTLLILQIGAYAVFALCFGGYLWQRHTTGPPACCDAVSIAGALVATGGMILRIVAIRTLGKWFTAAVVLQDSQTLIRHGVYRWIRHPSYTGAVLFWGALPFLLDVPLCAIAAWPILAFIYAKRISAEETALRSRFSVEYDAYAAKSWKLLPLVY
jgi:protein-S-isoprenylcysteine O-methyltransferase